MKSKGYNLTFNCLIKTTKGGEGEDVVRHLVMLSESYTEATINFIRKLSKCHLKCD